MRLINVKTHQLKEFFGDNIPAYCILSHTWGEEEVTYSDLAGTAKPGSKPYAKKAGYQKITFAKDQTLKDGHEYLWVDTCCIDKSSSARTSDKSLLFLHCLFSRLGLGIPTCVCGVLVERHSTFPLRTPWTNLCKKYI
jgi:hypothetical protein